MTKKLTISGVGCSLVDNLYNNISFSDNNFTPFLSKESGDGGLTPGNLVFKRSFEKFSKNINKSGLKDIILNKSPNKINIGGPGIVSMIHAAQLSDKDTCEFNFYGVRGNDANGNFIMSLLDKTPLLVDNYKLTDDETPSTVVLSDPNYNDGNGERIFINTIGAAWEYSSVELDQNFFNSDIVVFGGTALMPLIHDHLTQLLKKSKDSGCITIVNTVYDFRNERTNSTSKWPLGNSDDSYKNIDLLIMDHEEAIRLSGKTNISQAMQFFKDSGTGAVIVTSGMDNIRVFSNGKLFGTFDYLEMPISNAVSKDLKEGKGHSGDTTGCGDNFVGGVIASIVAQVQRGISTIDLIEASSWGVVSGGTACFFMGGMFEEKSNGEKMKMIKPYFEKYKKQIIK